MAKTVVIPAGSIVRGFVSSVRAAGKIDRRGSLTLSFDELRISERSYKLRASVLQALDGKISQDTTRIGAGAVVGGIIGGITAAAKARCWVCWWAAAARWPRPRAPTSLCLRARFCAFGSISRLRWRRFRATKGC